MISASATETETDHVALCHGLLSQVSDDATLHHCCPFTYSPTVIQRKPVASVVLFSICLLSDFECSINSSFCVLIAVLVKFRNLFVTCFKSNKLCRS